MIGSSKDMRSAAILTCTNCGRIEWFLADPQETA
jgi:hypothetical protein